MKKNFLLFGLLISFLLNIDIVLAAEYVKCGNITGIPSGLPAFSRNIINIIKFAIPIILCILGMFDFSKSVMANDEKAMNEGPKKFIKRVIAAVLVFFVVSIVQFIFNVLGNSDPEQEYMNKDNLNSCLKCFISDESGCTEDTETGNEEQA